MDTCPKPTKLKHYLIIIGAVCLLSVTTVLPASGEIPRRIVSVVPAVTQILLAIGAGPQITGVSSFDDSQEVASLPKVGALLNPYIEKIFSLSPDLVVLYKNQIEEHTQLKRARIKTFLYHHGTLPDIPKTVRTIGKHIWKEFEAEQVAVGIETELRKLKEQTTGLAKPKTLLVFGREPNSIRNVYASGGVGFLHDILEVAGATNVFADIPREATRPSSETILAVAPEIIIELRSKHATENNINSDNNAWKTFSSLPAVKSEIIYVLTGNDLVVPGPNVAHVAKQIAELIHPEAF